MKAIILAISLMCFVGVNAQTDYYEPQLADTTQHVMTKKEQRQARKRERQMKNHGKSCDCYCPSQRSTTVWHDVWNEGVVGTGKAIYQSTIKPQVIGEVVGAVQQAANESPLPTIAAQTGVALGISEIQKSRRHQRNRQVPRAGQQCTCDNCPYHGQRYKPNQGIQ